MTSDEEVLGVVVLARHGDRQGFYQHTATYTPTLTTITSLGTQQEFQLGQLLRKIYLDPSSPTFINGINHTFADQNQIHARADAGGEGGVIFNSALSLLQGLYPANQNDTTLLANGTSITSPLGGYQYVPLESVEPDNDISLEGWTKCRTFNSATDSFYNSAEFKAKAVKHSAFLEQLPKYLDGRPVTLENMWNVFDYMLVQSVHNKAFLETLPETFLEQGRDLANWHEYGIFSSPQLDGIGNIAGRTILPSIVTSLERIADTSDPLRFVYMATAYKPIISLFNMTYVASMNPELAGFANFAGAVALEVRKSSNGPVLRFNFKNGTADDYFKPYKWMNLSEDVPLSTFINHVAPLTINTTADWCDICGNVEDRGCGALALAEGTGRMNAMPHGLNVASAGILGAGVSLAFTIILLGGLILTGFLSFNARRKPYSHKV